jgi:hypothetical protein
MTVCNIAKHLLTKVTMIFSDKADYLSKAYEGLVVIINIKVASNPNRSAFPLLV